VLLLLRLAAGPSASRRVLGLGLARPPLRYHWRDARICRRRRLPCLLLLHRHRRLPCLLLLLLLSWWRRRRVCEGRRRRGGARRRDQGHAELATRHRLPAQPPLRGQRVCELTEAHLGPRCDTR
jgi:hypothetical protein